MTGTTILVPYHPCQVTTTHLIKIGHLQYRIHLQVPNLQLTCRDLTVWQDTRIVVPTMAARWHALLWTAGLTTDYDTIISSKHRSVFSQVQHIPPSPLVYYGSYWIEFSATWISTNSWVAHQTTHGRKLCCLNHFLVARIILTHL